MGWLGLLEEKKKNKEKNFDTPQENEEAFEDCIDPTEPPVSKHGKDSKRKKRKPSDGRFALIVTFALNISFA